MKKTLFFKINSSINYLDMSRNKNSCRHSCSKRTPWTSLSRDTETNWNICLTWKKKCKMQIRTLFSCLEMSHFLHVGLGWFWDLCINAMIRFRTKFFGWLIWSHFICQNHPNINPEAISKPGWIAIIRTMLGRTVVSFREKKEQPFGHPLCRG